MAFLTPSGEEWQPFVIGDPGPPGGGEAGGPGFQGPFIPGSGFASGTPQGFAGFPQGTYGGMFQRRLMAGRGGAPRSPLSQGGNQPLPSRDFQAYPTGAGGLQQSTNAGGMSGFPGLGQGPAALGSWLNGLRSAGWQPGQPLPGQQQGPDRPFQNGALGPIGALLQNAFMGGDPNYGGAFSLNPPQAIMNAIRGQVTQDQGAYERAARLGLQSRGDTDPSTYGFQALQSQLGGQDRASQAMNQASTQLRQQQLENYWRLLSQLLGAQVSTNQAEMAGRWAHANQPSGLGGALGGLGGLLGGLGGRGGGGGSAPRMGQPGFEYPRA